MHPVGETDRRSRSRYFQAGKSGGIVDHIVGDQDFLPPTSLKIAGGRVIEAAKDAYTGEQQGIGPVPEGVGRRNLGRRRGSGDRSLGGHLACLPRWRGLLCCGSWGEQEATCQEQGQDAGRTVGHLCIVAGNKPRGRVERCRFRVLNLFETRRKSNGVSPSGSYPL